MKPFDPNEKFLFLNDFSNSSLTWFQAIFDNKLKDFSLFSLTKTNGK